MGHTRLCTQGHTMTLLGATGTAKWRPVAIQANEKALRSPPVCSSSNSSEMGTIVMYIFWGDSGSMAQGSPADPKDGSLITSMASVFYFCGLGYNTSLSAKVSQQRLIISYVFIYIHRPNKLNNNSNNNSHCASPLQSYLKNQVLLKMLNQL